MRSFENLQLRGLISRLLGLSAARDGVQAKLKHRVKVLGLLKIAAHDPDSFTTLQLDFAHDHLRLKLEEFFECLLQLSDLAWMAKFSA